MQSAAFVALGSLRTLARGGPGQSGICCAKERLRAAGAGPKPFRTVRPLLEISSGAQALILPGLGIRTKSTDLGEKLDLLHLVLDLGELSQPAVIAVKGSIFGGCN